MKPAEETEQMNLPPDQPNLAEQAAKRPPVKSLAALALMLGMENRSTHSHLHPLLFAYGLVPLGIVIFVDLAVGLMMLNVSHL